MSRRIWILVAVFLCTIPRVYAQADSHKDFNFSAVDLKLLEEVSLLDLQFEKKGMVYRDPALNSYLEEIAHRLMPDTLPPEHVQFKCRVLRDPMVNAFAMPNGSIYVNSGLLAVLENEAQLASVLAHEITHVNHRHTYLQNRSMRRRGCPHRLHGWRLAGRSAVNGDRATIAAEIRQCGGTNAQKAQGYKERPL